MFPFNPAHGKTSFAASLYWGFFFPSPKKFVQLLRKKKKKKNIDLYIS